MIGNDVIDLRDPETFTEHPRFDERVFAPAERELLAAAGDARRLRWILWAAKESAYKLARKLDARAVFSPPRFVVDPTAGEVAFGGRRFALEIHADDDRIHAVVTTGGGAIRTGAALAGAAAPGVA
ncbi:MAG: 4'-phosphopantetheinyl transferase superfamily protein, partial [Candidatus Binatia bacterium]